MLFSWILHERLYSHYREWFACTSRCSNHTVTCPVLTVTWTVDGFSRSLDSHCMRSRMIKKKNRFLFMFILYNAFLCRRRKARRLITTLFVYLKLLSKFWFNYRPATALVRPQYVRLFATETATKIDNREDRRKTIAKWLY